jgi:hypothetical protein
MIVPPITRYDFGCLWADTGNAEIREGVDGNSLDSFG